MKTQTLSEGSSVGLEWVWDEAERVKEKPIYQKYKQVIWIMEAFANIIFNAMSPAKSILLSSPNKD